VKGISINEVNTRIFNRSHGNLPRWLHRRLRYHHVSSAEFRKEGSSPHRKQASFALMPPSESDRY
jgi:hypothetical protein